MGMDMARDRDLIEAKFSGVGTLLETLYSPLG